MCGICGLLGRHENQAADGGVLKAMNAAMVHRGPDDAGDVVAGPLGLAMRRLSIIDLAGGHQPMANEDGTILAIQNGEIYNYRELRAELLRRGHVLRTSSDTEVLVHLYEEYGSNFVDHLRGMFAIALWDARSRRLLLARDPFGIKPLYYRRGPEGLSFASELKCLRLVPGFSREIDPHAVECFLALGWIPAPLTIYRDARKLRPGHLLIADREGIREELYRGYRPVPAEQVRSEGFADLAVELRARIRDSVRAHLVADVPVGVLLSGGVDSSLLTALAAQEGGGRLKTFSIGFEEASHNELDRARLVAERYQTDHHELVVRSNALDLLPRIVDVFDEPFADSSALPTYLVSQLASENVKVALAGEGGDELFGGYFRYAADRMAPYLGRAASMAGPLIERLPSSSGALRLDDKAKRFARAASLNGLERQWMWGEVFSEQMRDDLLGSHGHGRPDPMSFHRQRWAETRGAQGLARAMDLDVGYYLADDLLTKTDRCSMAHSLETRVPFLDRSVAELALAVPDRFKVRGLAKKRLLRAAAEPLIPPQILSARKQGFSLPLASWLRRELEPMARDLLSASSLRAQGYIEPIAGQRVLDDHLARRFDNSRQLWSLMVLSLWLDAERATQPSTTAVRRA